MSDPTKIVPVGQTPPRTGEIAKPTPKAKSVGDARLHKAAEEFEAMFVRQLLANAKIGGKEKEDGYDGMAVDALASAVTKGGGLGLAHQIEEAIRRAHPEPTKK